MDNRYKLRWINVLEKKYSRLFCYLSIIVAVFLGGYLLGMQHNKKESSNSDAKPLEKPELVIKRNPIYKLSTPIISSDNNLYLRFRSEETESSYQLSLLLDDYPNPHEPLVLIEGEEKSDAVLSLLIGNKNQLQRMFDYPSNYITWSPHNKRMALLLPEKVVMYEYSIEPMLIDTYSPKRNRVTIKIVHEIPIEVEFDQYDYPLLIFSGDGQQLYFSSSRGVRMMFPEVSTIKTQEGYHSANIYPIPNSPGIAYWVEAEIPGSTHHAFVIDDGNKPKKFQLLSNFDIDYHHQIELSPDLRKVCVGWETSGGRGKVLFDLLTGKQIALGTGCIKWINSNEMVIQGESLGTNSIEAYYWVNLLNGEKTLLHYRY